MGHVAREPDFVALAQQRHNQPATAFSQSIQHIAHNIAQYPLHHT